MPNIIIFIENCRHKFTMIFILLNYSNILYNIIPVYQRRECLIIDSFLTCPPNLITFQSFLFLFPSNYSFFLKDTVISQRWRKIDRTINCFCQSRQESKVPRWQWGFVGNAIRVGRKDCAAMKHHSVISIKVTPTFSLFC